MGPFFYGNRQSLIAAITTNQASRKRAHGPGRAASSAYLARPQSVLIQRCAAGVVMAASLGMAPALGRGQDDGSDASAGMGSLLRLMGCSVAVLLASGPVQAGVVTCRRPGVPVGCKTVTPVARPGGPVVNPSPGVGYGAPGAGVRPAAGPGPGPNTGGPVNRAGRR